MAMDKPPENHQEMAKLSEPSSEAFDSPTKSICLSAALENLPLVYLPQTKQLVTASWHQPGPDNIHSTTSPYRTRGSCSDIPEFHYTDDCSGVKSLAGSKISEDSGNPELWDSDVSLSREIHSERNSSIGSGDLLDCDLTEADECSARTEMCSSDELNDVTFPSPLQFESPVNTTSSTENSCSSTILVVKDLKRLNISNDLVADAEQKYTGVCSPSTSPGDICDSKLVSPSQMLRTKRGVLASLFTSSWFSPKAKSQQEKLPDRDCIAGNEINQNQETAKTSSPSSSLTFKKSDLEKSTTALILQERPRGLPLKDPEEEARHRYLYQAMVEEAKQKERKDAKRQKQKLKQQLKLEASTASALKVWSNEILPNWDTANSKRSKELWWNGIPPRIRGRIWQLAIGNELNITAELYEICLIRAKDRLRILKDTGSDTDSLSSFTESTMSRESSVELIRLDVSRTFPNLCIFQKGGPYHDMLQGLLGSYACYRPDVGYVQGMSFIGAMLLLNMEAADAFICFANLLNKPCLLAFFRLDRSLMDVYFETFDEFFRENLPHLHQHMHERNVTADLYLLDWLFTLYAKSLSLDVVSRVWDVYFRDGEEFLFQTALGILKMYEDVLLNLDFIQLAQFLTRLPSDVPCDNLFACIASISMEINKQQFAQVLSQHRDARVT